MYIVHTLQCHVDKNCKIYTQKAKMLNSLVEFVYLVSTARSVLAWLAHGQWFSPGTQASSTTKTCHHDIAEILLKVALNTMNQIINLCFLCLLDL
jgi:hypothetical protein